MARISQGYVNIIGAIQGHLVEEGIDAVANNEGSVGHEKQIVQMEQVRQKTPSQMPAMSLITG